MVALVAADNWRTKLWTTIIVNMPIFDKNSSCCLWILTTRILSPDFYIFFRTFGLKMFYTIFPLWTKSDFFPGCWEDSSFTSYWTSTSSFGFGRKCLPEQSSRFWRTDELLQFLCGKNFTLFTRNVFLLMFVYLFAVYYCVDI